MLAGIALTLRETSGTTREPVWRTHNGGEHEALTGVRLTAQLRGYRMSNATVLIATRAPSHDNVMKVDVASAGARFSFDILGLTNKRQEGHSA